MSFPRYPKYKPSGVEWLGDVPQHWDVKRLKQACRVFPSNVDKKCHDGETPVVLCNYTDVYYNEKITPAIEFMAATASSDQIAKFTLRAGDTIITKDSETADDIAVAAYVPEDLSGVVCGYHLSMVRPLPHISGAFVTRLFGSVYAKSRFATLANGLTRVGLGQYELDNVLLPFPPHDEQTQIASFLDRETSKIDGLVGEQRRLMELLKEKRQAVISHAVTKGLNSHAPLKPSGIEWLGDVPKAWTVTKLGRAAFMQEGPGLRNWQFTDDGTRVICVTNITENGIDFSRLEKFISTDEYNSSYRHFTVQTGDVLLSSSGNSWGKVAIYEGDEEVMLNTSTMRLNESEGRPLIRDFLAMVLQSITVREQLGLAMTGSCQPNFGPTHLSCVMVAVPSRQEQSEIVAFVARATAKLDALTAEAERGIELLQERRTALISAAVTGQIDVRGLAETEAA